MADDVENGTPFVTPRAGAVSIYKRQNSSWLFDSYLTASNLDAYDEFGSNVSLNATGDLLAVASIREDSSGAGISSTDDDNLGDSGAVYLFSIVNGSWQQIAKIKSPSPAASEFFGSSLALSNDGATLVVGASNVYQNPYSAAGAAYVYRYSNNAWVYEAELIPNNIGSSHKFGFSIAVNSNGSRVAVGAVGEVSDTTGVFNSTPVTNNNALGAGAVYMFAKDTRHLWQQQAFIKAANAEGRLNSSSEGDAFGHALALTSDGNRLIVSAMNEDSDSVGLNANDNNASTDTGAVYIYDFLDNAWQYNQMIKANNTFINAQFGFSLSTSANGETIAVGSIQPLITETGSVYVY